MYALSGYSSSSLPTLSLSVFKNTPTPSSSRWKIHNAQESITKTKQATGAETADKCKRNNAWVRKQIEAPDGKFYGTVQGVACILFRRPLS